MYLTYFRLYLFSIILLAVVWDVCSEEYSNSWAVRIIGGEEVAGEVAKRHGFHLVKKTHFDDIYHFKSHRHPERSKRAATYHHNKLRSDPNVVHVEQQVIKRRHKRDVGAEPKSDSPGPERPYSPPTDLFFHLQWYLAKAKPTMNVQPVWEMGVSGKGVVVSILDDGLQYTHPDLRSNYDPHASFDYNGEDTDPSPRLDVANTNKHGTRCAGEVAAVKNDLCITGVAYDVSIGGIRMLDGSVTDLVEGSSLGFRPQHIDIYSSSWGPEDDGRTLDGPGSLAKKSLEDGANRGRSGLGSIFVWASGNGGIHDSCNADGYALSIYTISVSSVSQSNESPWYSERCSSTLTSTYSSGSNGQKMILSTDIRDGCTQKHSGTSASAPMAAGILALALEVNPHLTWRDIQHLVVLSSDSDGLHGNWVKNGMGYKASTEFGFGVLNAYKLVNRARSWITVGVQHTCNLEPDANQPTSVGGYKTIQITATSDGCNYSKDESTFVRSLEHVQVILSLSINSGQRGDIEISLTSPSKTTSLMYHKRSYDTTRQGFHSWPLMSTHFWGENPSGVWKLSIRSLGNTAATVNSVNIVLYGTEEPPPSYDCIPASCDSECVSTCANSLSSGCDLCKHYRVKDTWDCVSHCPQGYYPDENSKTCLHCNVNCDECNSTFPSQCLACNRNFTIGNGSCTPFCADGSYYDHYSEGFCQPCHESCSTCIGGDNKACTSCSIGLFPVNGVCVNPVTECGERMYKDSYGSCKPCPLGCLKCTSHDNCLQCYNTDMLQHMCSMDCPGGFYYKKSTQMCDECHSTCLTCTGGSDPTDCTACTDGYHLSLESVCLPCCDFTHLLTACCNCTRNPDEPYKNTCSLVKIREDSLLGELRYIMLQTKPTTLIGVLVSFSIILLIGAILLLLSSLFIFPKTNCCFKRKLYRAVPTNHFQSLEVLQDFSSDKFEQ